MIKFHHGFEGQQGTMGKNDRIKYFCHWALAHYTTCYKPAVTFKFRRHFEGMGAVAI